MNPLRRKIARLIAAEGPIGIDRYMELALLDPEHGYYMRRDPFGTKGDFVTAPETSQIFGELLGLWCVQAWEDRGSPARIHLVELGPGRGTLMADVLRAATLRPRFLDAAEIIMIEASPALRAMQERALHGRGAHWTAHFGEVAPDAPLLILANEFLDALPVRQAVRTANGWRQRVVASRGDATLTFSTGTESMDACVPAVLRDAPDGSIFELSPAREAAVAEIARAIAAAGGAALFIDYGHGRQGIGDTLQAVKAHRYADPLDTPGEADLTAHVDFAALASAARNEGARVSGPLTQAEFLGALGIGPRAERLGRGASAEGRAGIDAGVDRLISPAKMGTLFKVLAVSALREAVPPGFPC